MNGELLVWMVMWSLQLSAVLAIVVTTTLWNRLESLWIKSRRNRIPMRFGRFFRRTHLYYIFFRLLLVDHRTDDYSIFTPQCLRVLVFLGNSQPLLISQPACSLAAFSAETGKGCDFTTTLRFDSVYEHMGECMEVLRCAASKEFGMNQSTFGKKIINCL